MPTDQAREAAGTIGARIADAIAAACHPRGGVGTSVGTVQGVIALAVDRPRPALRALAALFAADATVPALGGVDAGTAAPGNALGVDVDVLVARLFEEEGRPLVRLVRLFVDDRNAAEDLVQEGFIRLARNADRIRDPSKAAAYLRSIVLNLARDHNRRGLVSLRHHLPLDDARASAEDDLVLRDDQREVIEALRELPHRQRDCLVLRYYEELGIDAIARTLRISPNSVKTHLKRGLAAMERHLGAPLADDPAPVGAAP